MTDSVAKGRASVISAVQTPLGFFALVVLIVEAMFAILASLLEGELQRWVVISMIALIFLLVAIVTIMAFTKPDALFARTDPKREMDPRPLGKGDHVSIKPPLRKEILLPSGVIGWDDRMSSYVGRTAVIRKIDTKLCTVRLDVDGQEFDWAFEWLEKL